MSKPRVDIGRPRKVRAKWPHVGHDNYVGGQAYQPTAEDRQRVRMPAAMGAPQTDIAVAMKMDPKTLRKHFRAELDTAAVEANAQVAGKLFKNAMDGNVIAQIFWMKARGGWVDRREVNHNHTLQPALSHEDRLRMLEAGPGGEADGPEVVDGDAEEVDAGEGGESA